MIELSFVIPCLNSDKTIHRTLSSIFAQKMNLSFEVIVVDNGSTDKTVECAGKFPIQLLIEKKRGANHARNLGIKNSNGKFIAFIDSDVVLDPDWAQELMNYIKRKNLLAAQGKIIRIPYGNPNSLLEKYRCFNIPHPTSWIDLVTENYKIGIINTAACIYQKEALKKVQFFSLALRFHEDLDLTYKIRSLPDGAIGCTSSAKAYCYYTHGLFSYLNRALKYSYFLAYTNKKWNIKKLKHSFPKKKDFSLSFLDRIIYCLILIGQTFGQIAVRFKSNKIFTEENNRIKRIASLPKQDRFRVYFEDRELESF